MRFLAVCAKALLLLLLACTAHRGPKRLAYGHDHPVYGGTFTFADEDDIRTLDPAIGYDEVSWQCEHLIFNTLLAYDDQMRLVGDLARSWEVSDDGLTWTFHLRQGVRFHNGREMVAQDVVNSWNRIFDPQLASPGADFLGIIEGAEDVLEGKTDHARGLVAADRYTVRATLEHPDPTFANMVAMMFAAVIPIEEVEREGDRWPYHPVGTGPFMVEDWQLGEKTVFVRNPDYFVPGLPYLDKVVHLARYPRSVQFLKLEADELSEVNRLTSPDYLWVKSNPLWAPYLEEVSLEDTYAEMMNTEMEPFDNVWFRRAVSTAIDREKLRKLRNGRVHPSVSWIPPGIDGHVRWEEMGPEEREYYKYQRYDPELSKECLKKAGYPNGYTGKPITYWTLTSEGSMVSALSIQQDLAEVGIPIEIHNTTFPAYLSATGRRHTVQMAYTGWVMDYPDPRNFLETRFACKSIAEENSTNDSFYCNPKVDALLEEAATEPDRVRRKALYDEAQALISQDAPYAVEYHSTTQSVTQPYVKGFRIHPVYTRDITRAWLDLPSGREAP